MTVISVYRKKKSNIDLWLEESSEEEADGDGPPEKINYDHKVQAIELSTDHWMVQRMFKYIRVSAQFL